ncbi:MAG: hypothetical protein DI598_00820 [Pseudopedobacter saltans]|uniref:Uncharacterized protein n=1 Tax=Pseudopedobacter saltans TaxID=151895 RepID=A0A2W5FDF8_9SPHI|nr:MAG: hypothetical protein DI598_00820 [Pseudopedobacter saltans]
MNKKSLKSATLIALIHCVFGNIWGIVSSTHYDIPYWLENIVDTIFLPYLFIAGMSQWFGWDILSIIWEFVGLIGSFVFFFLLLKIIHHFRKKQNGQG